MTLYAFLVSFFSSYNILDVHNSICLFRIMLAYGDCVRWNWTAGRNGNVGVVLYATSNENLYELLHNGTDPPYIIVMNAQLFEKYVYKSNNDNFKMNSNSSSKKKTIIFQLISSCHLCRVHAVFPDIFLYNANCFISYAVVL